jgi:hypothetical protein
MLTVEWPVPHTANYRACRLAAVALGIAVLADETTLVQHLTRLDMPTVAAHIDALAKETKLLSWGALSLVMTLILSWIKLR